MTTIKIEVELSIETKLISNSYSMPSHPSSNNISSHHENIKPWLIEEFSFECGVATIHVREARADCSDIMLDSVFNPQRSRILLLNEIICSIKRKLYLSIF